MWLLLVIVEVPELSVLEGSGHVIIFPGTPKSTVSSILLGQPKICGGTSSTSKQKEKQRKILKIAYYIGINIKKSEKHQNEKESKNYHFY